MTSKSTDIAEKLAAEAEHAEQTRDTQLHYRRRRGAGAQAVYGLRLPKERITQLHRVAKARGIEPSVLARGWMIEALDRADAPDHDASRDRWERELRTATDHLRELLDDRPGHWGALRSTAPTRRDVVQRSAWRLFRASRVYYR